MISYSLSRNCTKQYQLSKTNTIREYTLKVVFATETKSLYNISVVDPDPELFAGSGSGSGINHFGSGSDLYPTFLLKSHIFSTKCTKNLNI
jgi:hypothetical protein